MTLATSHPLTQRPSSKPGDRTSIKQVRAKRKALLQTPGVQAFVVGIWLAALCQTSLNTHAKLQPRYRLKFNERSRSDPRVLPCPLVVLYHWHFLENNQKQILVHALMTAHPHRTSRRAVQQLRTGYMLFVTKCHSGIQCGCCGSGNAGSL
jgi:hypothetical protein